MIELIYSKYGEALPDRSAYRNDPKCPVPFRDLMRQFKSWGAFTAAYAEHCKIVTVEAKKPVPKVPKVPKVTTQGVKKGETKQKPKS